MKLETSLVRKPAVAGSFYPVDPEELDKQLSGLLDQAERISIEGRLKILLVPHAGIVFSGRTAAAGFKQLEGQNYSKIILLGVSHHVWFDYAAIYNRGVWKTPLGEVEVDEELGKAILAEEKKIIAEVVSHHEEHSLEMELIFLQKVLTAFKIVPILLSQVSVQLINDLASQISRNLDDQTLLVISSDLSHYLSWQVAKEVDQKTIKAILTNKTEDLVEDSACGREAIKVALKIGEILDLNFQKIKAENSGDVSGDKSRVVGYAAIGSWGQKLSLAKEALQIARKTLREYLKSGQLPVFTPQNVELFQHQGVFVTLRKKGELRGCIGEFEPLEPLYRVIQKMAVAAAVQDSRFQPVKAEELKEIKIEISVMTPKRKVHHWQEIKLGRHGVVIEKDGRSGTFLPQVATETGWSLEEFLSQLCFQKAGLPVDCYRDSRTDLYVFEVQVFDESKIVV